MKGIKIRYNDDELSWIKTHSSLPRKELANRFNTHFGRSVNVQNIKALCLRHGWKTGRNGQFKSGHVAWNLGKKGYMGPNKTSFKKGSQPHNTKYVGHESVTKDGYILISVNQTNPHTGFERRYVLKHRWVWEQANGEIPDGMCLKFKDGNRKNCSLDNLELIERKLLPALRWAGYDHAPHELRPVIMTTCKLQHAVRKAKQQ